MDSNVAALKQALVSGDPQAQAAAAEKLAQLGERAQGAAVELVSACARPEAVREWAAAALEGLGPPAENDLSRLTALLTDQCLDVAYWAATLLGRLGSRGAAAAEALRRAASDSPHDAVRRRAAHAVAEITKTNA